MRAIVGNDDSLWKPMPSYFTPGAPLYANVLGRENVIAATDSGLGGRIHPQIAWAKLRALSEGAALASKELWS